MAKNPRDLYPTPGTLATARLAVLAAASLTVPAFGQGATFTVQPITGSVEEGGTIRVAVTLDDVGLCPNGLAATQSIIVTGFYDLGTATDTLALDQVTNAANIQDYGFVDSSGGFVEFAPVSPTSPSTLQSEVRISVADDAIPMGSRSVTFDFYLPSAAPPILRVPGIDQLDCDGGGVVPVQPPSSSSLAVTITDNDATTVSVGPDFSVAEGDAGSVTVQVPVTVDGPIDPTLGVEVSWSIRTDDPLPQATPNVDFQADQGTLNFTTTSANPQFIDVTVIGDTEPEPSEFFVVALEQILFADPGQAISIVEIIDDDAVAPGLPITVSAVVTNPDEGDKGSLLVPVTLRAAEPLDSAATIAYQTRDATATVGDLDYAATRGEVVIPAGATEARFNLFVVGDTRVEADEVFLVDLRNESEPGQPGDRSIQLSIDQLRITIKNDDEPTDLPQVQVTGGLEAVEPESGQATAAVVVSISSAPSEAVTIGWQTRGDTALAGVDYLESGGSVVFPAGEAAERTLEIQILADTTPDSGETFFVDLALESGPAALVDTTAQVVILESGQTSNTVSFSQPRFEATEGDSRGTVRVRLERRNAMRVTAVARTTDGGSATAGEDFRPASYELVWEPDDETEKVLDLVPLDDNRQEGSESIAWVLENANGAQIGSPARATLELSDDDTPSEVRGVGSPTGETNSVLVLMVEVLDDQGNPVAGVPVTWGISGGNASLLGETVTFTDANGRATQQVDTGSQVGPVVITAAAPDRAIEPAVFTLQIGGFAPLFPTGTAAHSVATVLDNICGGGTLDYREVCSYLNGLPDDATRSAIKELTPTEIGGQALHALNQQSVLLRLFADRLAALRRGKRIQIDQLAMRLGDDTLNASMLAAVLDSSPAPQKALGQAIDDALERAFWRPQNPAPVVASAVATGNRSIGAAPQEQAAEDPLATYEYSESWGFFLHGRYSTGDRDRTARESGFDFDSLGVTAGIDYRFSDRFLAGIAVNFMSTETRLDQNGGGLDADGFSVALYTSYWWDRAFLDVIGIVGNSDYDMTRMIDLPAAFLSLDPTLDGRTRFPALSQPTSDQTALNVGTGYDFVTGVLAVTGAVHGYWLEADVDSFRESGAGPFNLEVDRQTLDSLLGEASVDLTWTRSMSWGILQPALRTSYFREFEDGERLIRGRFVNALALGDFLVPTDRPDRSFWNLGVSLNATLAGGTAIFLSWDTDLDRSALDIQTLTGGFRMAW